jgi:AraC-like DNA-binding protein
MIYKLIQPAPKLRPYIRDYVLLDFLLDPGSPTPVKPFPAHTDQTLVFYLSKKLIARDPETGQQQHFDLMAINGIQTKRLNFHLPNEYRMLAVDFQQGFLTKFLRMPLPELTDVRIDAEALLNPGISYLYERMLNSTGAVEMVSHLEDYLWDRINQIKMDWQPLDRVNHIMTQPNSFTVNQLADMACLSLSQFERRFILQTGTTPKYFARISRFNNAYNLKEADPGISWLGVALKTGYQDYQHMVKDFKAFAGELPQALLAAQAKAPEKMLSAS